MSVLPISILDIKCAGCCQKLNDVIKRIPDCSEPICGDCYGCIKQAMDESKQYKCPACNEAHIFTREMSDDKYLLGILQHKPIQLNDNAKKLMETIAQIEEKRKKIKEFDKDQEIQKLFEDLVTKVTDAFESAIKHLEITEKAMLEQIEEYRGKALEWSENKEESRIEESKELEDFLEKWKNYFYKTDKMKNDQEIDESQKEADKYISELETRQKSLLNEVQRQKIIEFYPSEPFLLDTNIVGELIERGLVEKYLEEAKEKEKERNFKESIKLRHEALRIYRRIQKYRSDNLDIIRCLIKLAHSYRYNGDKEECANVLKESVETCRKILKDNPFRLDIAKLLNELADSFSWNDNKQESEDLLKEAVDICRNLLKNNSDSLDVAELLREIAETYKMNDNKKEYSNLRKELADIYRKMLANNPNRRATQDELDPQA